MVFSLQVVTTPLPSRHRPYVIGKGTGIQPRFRWGEISLSKKGSDTSLVYFRIILGGLASWSLTYWPHFLSGQQRAVLEPVKTFF